jgi:hypothetical protein
MHPGAPAASTRPTVVTVATYLLYAVAALSLITSVISIGSFSSMAEVYENSYGEEVGDAMSSLQSIVVASLVFGIVIQVLISAGLVLLGIFTGRGRQGARVTTWVIGGIYLCCNGLSVGSTATMSNLGLDEASGGAGPSQAELERQLSAALPDWYQGTTTALEVVLNLCMLGAVVLLALPAAHPFFRRFQGQWDPSVPYPYPGQQPGYPMYGQPGYPPPGYAPPGYQAYQQPGYPQTGYRQPGYPPAGYPGYQPYPGQEPNTPPPGSGIPSSGAGYPGTPSSGFPAAPNTPSSGYPAAPHTPSSGYPAAPSSGYPGFPGAPGQPNVEPHTGSTPAIDPWGQTSQHPTTPPAETKGDEQPRNPTDPPA